MASSTSSTEATSSSEASSSSDSGGSTGTTDLGMVEPCTVVTLPGSTEGTWTAEGPLGFDLPRLEGDAWVYRAPVAVVETTVSFSHSSGATATLSIAAASHPPSLADGMAYGCGPFPFGVASGDPAADGVWLWTRVDPSRGAEVRWTLATDAAFERVVAEGAAQPDAASDFTINVHAEGLDPATTYFYRFALEASSAENDSVVGRTRTAPSGPADRLRFAVTSCTSIFSGYFNGYRAIARRLDLDGLIHVGDYIYDFPDEDELVRIPDPVPEDPESLEAWRDLHAYHLADPDLRAARAAHPWVMLWDNHDLNPGAPNTGGGAQAFREWNPLAPPPAGEGAEIVYRELPFGDLLDLVLIDVLLFRDDPDAPDGPDKTILGETQRAWFHQTLRDSSAQWKVIGNQKPVAVIDGLLVVLGGSTWNGFPDARAQMFEQLAADQIDGALFLSGDAHITVAADLVTAPGDPDVYDPKTGQGAVAAEFQPASMSRGNVDEYFPTQPGLPAAIEMDSAVSNPHYRFLETTRHGYGILDVDAERIEAEIWYLEILQRTDDEELAATLELRAGDRHWAR